MTWTDEERKAYMKEYRQDNKDKIKAYNQPYMKAWRAANKEKISAYNKEWNKANKEAVSAWHKAYNQTDLGIKKRRMNNWRFRGVNDVNEELYEYYKNCVKCEACGNSFTESSNKCLDHDHKTGDFRQVLCRGCNNHDSWRVKIISHTDTP